MVSVATNFPKSEDPTCRNLYPSQRVTFDPDGFATKSWMLSHGEAHTVSECRRCAAGRLTCSAWHPVFAEVHGAARATCHVPPIDPRPASSSFPRSALSNGAAPESLRRAVGRRRPKVLGQTNIQTYAKIPITGLVRPVKPPENTVFRSFFSLCEKTDSELSVLIRF